MYEHKKQPLASPATYYKRLRRNTLFAASIIILFLGIGMIGYKLTIPDANFTWYDSLLNASMILSGMGPVFDSSIHLSNAAKVFASCYAIFSGVMFITTIAIIITPIAHRFFHKLHIDDK
jgi:hypothetical protein